MSREWKRGDVAMVRSQLHGEERAVRRAGVWFFLDREGYGIDAYVTPIRPLVVIDPEDREQVERLAKAAHGVEFAAAWDEMHGGLRAERIDVLQAALREFADPKPPKPDEPTGLGAVVRDASGVRWVRAGKSHDDALRDNWRCVDGEEVGSWREWPHIDAVEVLSEGVTP